MPPFKDLTGQRFGKMTVIKRAENYYSPNGKPRIKWECKCDCGKTFITKGETIKSGHTKSCGCYHLETIKKAREGITKIEGVRVPLLTRKKSANKTSKYKGVSYHERAGKYVAYIALKGKQFYLGLYQTEEEAYDARTVAEHYLHFPFILEDSKNKKTEFLKRLGFAEEDIKEFVGDEDFTDRIKKALKIIEAS